MKFVKNQSQMSFTESIKTVFFDKYATFKGRAPRSEFWWTWLISLVMSFIPIINIIYYVITIVPLTAVIVRRVHDTNRSAWLVFAPLILMFIVPGIFFPLIINFFEVSGQFPLSMLVLPPVAIAVGISLWTFYLMFLKGDVSENRFGTNPLLEESTEDL